MNVIAWTFHPSDERGKKLGVRYVEFDELLSVSNVISLHLQQTAESSHMIGEREFALMKPGAILVNAARGSIVDTAALVDALNSGRLSGAGLDAFEEEPVAPDDPLLKCEHLVLTPHVADMTPEGLELLNEGVVDNVIAFFEDRPQNVVT
jgi:D-3-phosphoglycerate dehydrogenase